MGMPKIELRLQMFRGDWDQIWSQMRLLWIMEGLCRVNQTHLRQFDMFKERGLVERSYPPIYRAGLHYETEKGTEIWPDIPSMLAGTMGEGIYPGAWADCEDLACARVAEYRELPYHYEKEVTTNDGKRRLVRADPRFPQDDEAATAKNADISGAATKKIAELLGPGSVLGYMPEPELTHVFGDDEFPAGTETLASPPDGAPKSSYDPTAPEHWPGWKKVSGGVKAKPFAKWRKGPNGNYHYHALVLLPDGRLEDPSLVLGMGREKTFAAEGTAERLRDPAVPVRIQYAKPPSVMVVDPEKPSGYAGGQAVELDAKVKALIERGMAPEDISATLGDVEIGAYLANTIPLGEGEFDVDMVIGWNRAEGRFEPKTDEHELRRLAGYAGH